MTSEPASPPDELPFEESSSEDESSEEEPAVAARLPAGPSVVARPPVPRCDGSDVFFSVPSESRTTGRGVVCGETGFVGSGLSA